MKTKRIISTILAIVLAFSCMAVIPFVASTTASAASASATKDAVYIGKSKFQNNVSAAVFYPLTVGPGCSDGTMATFTCKVKMLSGTKPYISFFRPYSTTNTTYGAKPSWVQTGSLSGDTYTCQVKLEDIPGDGNRYKSETRSSINSISRTNGSGGVWGIIAIGNCTIDCASYAGNLQDFNDEFIISDPTFTIGGNSYSLNGFGTCNDNGIYNLIGNNTTGDGTNAVNHMLTAPKATWSKFTTDEDMVKFIKVDNDFLTSNRTYVKHAETATTREYYTCADYGDDVYFERFGTNGSKYCYGRIESGDIYKKSVVIGTDPLATPINGDRVTRGDASIFFPINVHKYFSHCNVASSTADKETNIKEGNGNLAVKITANVKRISGNSQPYVGSMWAKGETLKGYPQAVTDRAKNPGDASGTSGNYLTSSYNATTGEFTAYVRVEKGYYSQMSQYGGCYYITIGNVEYARSDSGGYDNYWSDYDITDYDASYVMSNIKMSVYSEDNITSSVLDSDASPAMVADNLELTKRHIKMYNDTTLNGLDISMNAAPLGKWSALGCAHLVNSVNTTACNSTSGHILNSSHVAKTATNCEYYQCSCGKAYADKYGSRLIEDTNLKNKMIYIKSSSKPVANVTIPLDTTSIPTDTNYYLFRCKMRLFGDQLPVLGVAQGAYYGYGGKMQNGFSSDSEDGFWSYDVGTYYDIDTYTYYSIFKMDRADPAHYCMDKYYNTLNGAHSAITLGNAKHAGNGINPEKYFASFAFTDPEILAFDPNTDDPFEMTGDNLCPGIDDSTINLDSGYSYGMRTSGFDYPASGDSDQDLSPYSFIQAPVNQWSVDGYKKWITAQDVPDNFFTPGYSAPKMFRIAGKGQNTQPVVYQTFIEPGKTYAFDYDYRCTGAQDKITRKTVLCTEANGEIEDFDKLINEDTGTHVHMVFTTPADIKRGDSVGDGNFKIYLGQSWGSNMKSIVSCYYANFNLREVRAESPYPDMTGNNFFSNPSFDYSTVNEILSADNAQQFLYGWSINNELYNYTKTDVQDIPANFFNDNATNDVSKAILMKGGNRTELQFKADLEPSANYKLMYNYRCREQSPTLELQVRGSNSNYTLTKVAETNNGKCEMTYNLALNANATHYSDNDPNIRFRFYTGQAGYGSEFYVSNIRLYRVDGNGNAITPNLVADINPIFASYNYPAITNVGDHEDLTLTQDDATAVRRIAFHNLLGTSGDGSAEAQIVKVSDDFFNYQTSAQVLATLKNVLLHKATADVNNPYYDNNTDRVVNILDYIKSKKHSVYPNDNGGVPDKAAALKATIQNNTSELATTSTNYYVDAVNGNDNNSGTSTDAPLATIQKAISKIGSSGGNKSIFLKRGTVQRIDDNSEDSIVLVNGVHLGAYGEGAKPKIYGSAMNYGGSSHTSHWTNVTGNIWKIDLRYDKNWKNQYTIHDANQIGGVYLFNSADDAADVPTVIGRRIVNGARFSSYSQLSQEGDFYVAPNVANDGFCYVYCSSNPATKYSRIELAEKRHTIEARSNNQIKNVDIRYSGGHGIYVAAGATNMNISYCDIHYIGGAPNNDLAFGNGVQFSDYASNSTVDHCYVTECFDAGLTFQSYTGDTVAHSTFDGISFTNNLVEKCYYNIEFFTVETAANKVGSSKNISGVMKNITIEGNIMRFAGYGVSGDERMASEGNTRCANLCVTRDAWYSKSSNIKIQNNTFDCTRGSHVFWTWKNTAGHGNATHVGVTTGGNSFYQCIGSWEDRVNSYGDIEGYTYARGTGGLEAAIEGFDPNYATVAWVAPIGLN